LQNEQKRWVIPYYNYLKQCLLKSNNLSEIEDKAKARENLELTGDNNTTHYHDSHYLPLINSMLTGNVQALLDALKQYFIASATAPANPVNDQTIWFDLNTGLIKYYRNNTWNIFGAKWSD
jgi:hypothetical protein